MRSVNSLPQTVCCPESILESIKMYCLQWLIPVLLIPKPVNPALLYNHAVLMVLYLTGFFLERKPCTICSIVFAVALALVWSSSGYTLNCVLFGEDCSPEENDSAMII